ncbi:MAG: hypothetical protein R2707_02350 [Acidimicrobiales bacterium]
MNRTDHAEAAAQRLRFRGDRGEGVISTAIAVLIVAFIGAAMWVAFNSIWTDAEGNIQREVGNIGASPAP